MQSFSQFTTQLGEATSSTSRLPGAPSDDAVDRLIGKKRKERLDRASKILINLRDSGKLYKMRMKYDRIKGLDTEDNRKQLATANVRIKSLAGSLGRNKKRIDRAAERIAKKYNERTGKNVSVADVRKVIVRKAVSRATNRMKTRAARSRLNENLHQLDEFITNIVGSGVQALGDIAAAYMQNRVQQAMQKKTQRMEKRRALQQAQSQQDIGQGMVPTQTNVSNLQINTNPRATVAQLRGSAGAELGGSSVGKQFAAMY